MDDDSISLFLDLEPPDERGDRYWVARCWVHHRLAERARAMEQFGDAREDGHGAVAACWWGRSYAQTVRRAVRQVHELVEGLVPDAVQARFELPRISVACRPFVAKVPQRTPVSVEKGSVPVEGLQPDPEYDD